MKQYIIFDLDGTLIQSTESSFEIQYNILKKYIPDLERDYLKYYFNQTAGTALEEQLDTLCKNKLESTEIKKITDEIYEAIIEHRDEVSFFPWVETMLQNLHSEYKFFLSTWNSDQYAQKILSEAGLDSYFEKILGSSIVHKSVEHIKIFSEIACDDEFAQKAIYIWDGNTDRDIAQSAWIDFIKVWEEWIDSYEVDHTTDAMDIITQLNTWNI